MNRKLKTLFSLGCFVFAVAAFADAKEAASTDSSAPAVTAMPAMPATPEVDASTWNFLPETVATVGNTKITKDDLIRILNPQVKMMIMMGQQPDQEQIKEMAKFMTTELVKAKLLENMASEAGYKVTPQLEDEVYNEFLANMKSQMPPGADKDFNFEDIIKQQGFTVADVKKQMAEGKVIQNWIEAKIAPTVTVSDKEVETFYNDNKDNFFRKPETVTASQILIQPKDDSDAALNDAKTEAEGIYKQLQDGANFEDLANKYNEGPKNGGEIGTFSKGQMIPEFEEASFKLAKNGMKGYELVESQFGWHIIKVTAHDPGGYMPLDDALKAQIKAKLQQDAVFTKINSMIDEQMKKVNPVINI